MTSQFVGLFPKYDPRAEYINPTLFTITDTGIMDRMFRSRMPHVGMREQEDLAEEAKLEMQHFYLPFMFMSAGIALAVISALSEKYYLKTI